MIMVESAFANVNSGAVSLEVVGTPSVHVAVAWVAESIVTEAAATPMNLAFPVYPEVKKFTPVKTMVLSVLVRDLVYGIVLSSWGV